MEKTNSHQNFIIDAVRELFHRAKENKLNSTKGDVYSEGINMGYYQCLNTLLGQADAYGINLEKECGINKDELMRLI